MTSSETGTAVCPGCGEAASGNFCSACGARLVARHKAALDDLPLIGESIGLARAFWRTARAPIAEPVRVAGLAGDKSPYTFLIAGVGMFIGFFIGMEALAKAWGVSGFTHEQQQFLSVAKYAIVIHLTVAAAVVYAGFALVAGRKVGIGQHARLWALLGGYYLTAEALLLIAVVTIYAVIFFALPDLAPAALSIMSVVLAPAVIGVLLALLANLVAAHARLWAKPLWMSAGIFALALVATHLIAPPLQASLISAIGDAATKLGMAPLFEAPP